MLKRRTFLGAGVASAAATLAGCATPGIRNFQRIPANAPLDPSTYVDASFAGETQPVFYDSLVDGGRAIPAVPKGVVEPRYWRQLVDDPTGEPVGTLVVDPDRFFLYLVRPGGKALRYGVGVGRDGFGWSGTARVQYKRHWPRWKVPMEMVARQPELERWSVVNGGMPGGLENPLGARALYLFQNGKDTLYRLHGTNEPGSIGKAVSSGCIRLLNQDIIDLDRRVPDGTRVVVRSSTMPSGLS